MRSGVEHVHVILDILELEPEDVHLPDKDQRRLSSLELNKQDKNGERF